jgi:large-conductance mechanosensitive channel
MDQLAKTFTPEGTDTRNWIGRLIVAVILGEAIWNLIVSVMSNLVVPWLGDVMGQSSGLPTSFTQRPYNYPDLFVAIVELCIAGIVAAILNHFFQRPTARKVKAAKIAPPAPLEPGLSVRQPVERTQPVTSQTEMIQPVMTRATPSVAPRVEGKAVPVVTPVPAVAAPAPPVPGDATATISKPVSAASPAPPVADSAAKASPAVTMPEPVKLESPKLESPKPKKPKAVYYNIVGEPVSSDED